MSCILDVWTIDTIISQSLFTKMFRACVVKLAFLTQVHGFIVVYILFEVQNNNRDFRIQSRMCGSLVSFSSNATCIQLLINVYI